MLTFYANSSRLCYLCRRCGLFWEQPMGIWSRKCPDCSSRKINNIDHMTFDMMEQANEDHMVWKQRQQERKTREVWDYCCKVWGLHGHSK